MKNEKKREREIITQTQTWRFLLKLHDGDDEVVQVQRRGGGRGGQQHNQEGLQQKEKNQQKRGPRFCQRRGP